MTAALAETPWEAMCRQPERLMPFIERVAGYYLAFAERDGDGRIVDRPMIDQAVQAMPDLRSLSDDELDFVHYAAIASHYEYDLDYEVRSMVRAWITGGACI